MLKITIKSLLLIKNLSLSFVLNVVARMKVTLWGFTVFKKMFLGSTHTPLPPPTEEGA